MRISDWSSDVCSSDLQPHWRFFGYGMLLFLVMMLSTLPMTAIGSVIAGALGLAGTPGAAGPRIMIVLLLVFLGMLYVSVSFGFIFPAVAVEENYSLRLAWQRSDERRVGKEGVSTCESRWA